MSNAIPRWLIGRAGRMSAYLLECLIEAHGHRALCAHFARPVFWKNFASAIGSRETGPMTLLALCERGVLPKDRIRLRLFIDSKAGQIGDASGMRVFVPEDAVVGPEAGNNILPAPNETLEIRLGSYRALSMQRPSGALAHLSHMPVLGSRSLMALSLLADWIAEPVQEHPLALAFGDRSGEPGPLLLRVYDACLRTLESLLTQTAVQTSRLAPLWMLHEQRRQLESLSHPQQLDKWRQRELKMSRNLLGFGGQGPVGHDAPVPRLWRRPRISQALPPPPGHPALPLSWQPDESAALDDLFLP